MAKIRVAQIKDLSLTGGVITIGPGNSITPLTTVSPLTEDGTNKFVSGFTVTGNTIAPTFTEISFDGYATEIFVGNAINTALADYSTTEQMNSAISTALAGYYTKDEIDATLGNYVLGTTLATTLQDYVLKSSINVNTLAPTSTETIPSEKTVADYVAAELAKIDTQAYTAGNGIDIANHVVSAKVATGEKVLSVDANGLKTSLNLTYDSTAKQIKLWGISTETPIATVDATDFIKDGMLANATFDSTSNDLTLTFNTDSGKQDIVVPMDSLVDTYTADEVYLTVENNKFSHKEVLENEVIVGNKTSDLVFSYPKLTVDKAGHVTQVAAQDITIQTATTIAATDSTKLATEGAVKTYVDGQFSAQATKHVHQESDTTTITLNSTPVNTTNSNFDVYQNGIRLNESEFAVAGTTLTITPDVAHVAGDKYLVCYVAKA